MASPMKGWRRRIRQWFPDLHTRAYFVPPVHFNKVPYAVSIVCGHPVLVPQAVSNELGQVQNSQGYSVLQSFRQNGQGQNQSRCQSPRCQNARGRGGRGRGRRPGPPGSIWHPVPPVNPPRVLSSDIRDDLAQQHVLHCLRALAVNQQEVMVVVSQLTFGNYLGKPSYAAAASSLPHPKTLEPRHQRGDFDLLMIHRQFGLIVGEVKSVGANASEVENLNRTIVDRVRKAAEQLLKARTVLGYLVSDIVQAPLNITLTLILPFVTAKQLREALNTDSKVKKELCGCLDIPPTEDPVKLCLCQDQLSPVSKPWEVSDVVMRELHKWWHRCIRHKWSRWLHERGGSDLKEDERAELYEQLLARFCGPATTVEIPCLTSSCPAEPRTEGEAAAEVGLRMTQLALYPEQVGLVNSGRRLVFLSGPPGTGKTVVLVLTAIIWLQQGKVVEIASTWERSRAICTVIEQQLRHSLGKGPEDECPQIRLHHFQFDRHRDGDQNVDDAVNELCARVRGGQLYVIADEAGPEGSDRFERFCDMLIERVPTLYLWAANVVHAVKPHCLEEMMLTVPLRSPPAITREVAASGPIKKGWIHDYTQSTVPPPTDGLPVLWLRHKVLVKGVPTGHREGDPEDCPRCGEVIAEVLRKLHVGQGALQYRDVLILCDNPHDQETDSHGNVASPATSLVQGLRERNVPVQVIRSRCQEDALHDMALAKHDRVIVTHYDVVSGLERKVVVGVGSKNSEYYVGRPYSMSRCTAQLIWIKPIDEDDEDDDESDDDVDDDWKNFDPAAPSPRTSDSHRK